jgi:very-short-patch-repair endonuclease
MRDAIDEILDSQAGAASRAQLHCAALASVGGNAAISHTSALRRWGLDIDDSAVHVTTTADHRVRGDHALVVHRTKVPLPCQLDRGVMTVAPGAAAVQAWVASPYRRAHVIELVRRRLATTDEVLTAVEHATRLPRRGELFELVDLLAGGRESELEIWGHRRVFDTSGLRHGKAQLEILAGGARYRLDRAYVAEKVAVELDEAAYHSSHSSRDHRERDRPRDVALATEGWVTIRFSHRRLTSDPVACRLELLAVLAARRERAFHGS